MVVSPKKGIRFYAGPMMLGLLEVRPWAIS